MQLETIEDVYAEQLADLRSAETQLLTALPKMASAASEPELKQAFTEHLAETRSHLERLDEIISTFDPSSVPQETCEAMQGLIAEGEEVVNAGGNDAIKDVALIAAAQRVEHYEIAAYRTARTLAGQLDMPDAQQLLDVTLDEESKADKLLTKLATGGIFSSGINERASQ